MSFLARNDVSLPSKDDELLDYDELIRGIDEQLLAIDALPLPSPPPAAAVPFSVPPSPLSANAATSPERLEAAAAPGWVVAAGPESLRWDVLWGAGVMDDSGVDAGSAHVRPRPPPQPPPPPQCVRIAARL